MGTGFIRVLRIGAVGAVALAVMAQTCAAAAQKQPVRPIAGTFSGSDNENGVVTSWNGTVSFATAAPDTCCFVTTAHVKWSVKGTDAGNGCTSVGNGQFAVLNGKLVGVRVPGGVSIDSAGYAVSFDTGGATDIPGYNEFGPITMTCPQRPPITTTAHISDWLDDGFGGPYHVKPGGLLHDGDRSIINSGSFHAEKRWSWNLSGMSCPKPNVKTGTGYAELTRAMKKHLATLYKNLDHQQACYRFTIGHRDKARQKDLYDRWHQLADGHKGQKNLCQALIAAGFAQCPTGWRKDGTARGGPAKPGTSRHERGEAADLTVRFLPGYQEYTDRFRTASHEVGLCGPTESDPVHVELPYSIRGQSPACHFEGPGSRRPCLVTCVASMPRNEGSISLAEPVVARLR